MDIEFGTDTSDFSGFNRITVQFETFKGAHNPPFDLNTVTYEISDIQPLIVREVRFEHSPLRH